MTVSVHARGTTCSPAPGMKRTASRASIDHSPGGLDSSSETDQHVDAEVAHITESVRIRSLRTLIDDSISRLPPELQMTFREDVWLLSRRDDDFLRFMNSYPGNAAAAALAVLNTAEWRQRFRINNIVDEWPQTREAAARVIRNYWPAALTGASHDGTPVQYTHFRCIDFQGLRRRQLVEHAVRHSVYLLELAAVRDPRGQEIMIFDMGCTEEESQTIPSFSFSAAMHFLRTMAETFRPNYPLHAVKTIIVRAPAFFRAAWTLVQPFMPSYLTSTLIVSGGVPMARLLELMPMEAIPASLGGTSPVWVPSGGYLEQRAPPSSMSACLPLWRRELRLTPTADAASPGADAATSDGVPRGRDTSLGEHDGVSCTLCRAFVPSGAPRFMAHGTVFCSSTCQSIALAHIEEIVATRSGNGPQSVEAVAAVVARGGPGAIERMLVAWPTPPTSPPDCCGCGSQPDTPSNSFTKKVR